jgi:hypothetical protein
MSERIFQQQCGIHDCRLKIGGDGVYYFDTELAGNEAVAGWGPDPKPHIHFELDCRCDE